MSMVQRLVRYGSALPRDKADTLLLMAATVLVLAPHAAHLPLWVSALCAATLIWRGVITWRGTRMPPMLALLAVSLVAMGGVYLNFRTLLGRDAGVAMLVLLVAFKMLEMRARRDLFVVIFLCFFLVLTNFFYSQSMLTGLMMVLSIIMLFTAQLSFQFTGTVPPLRRRLAMGARVFVMAAPLAVVLFFVFPRIQGPLWGMPGDAGSNGRSGLSRSMAPGNISNLAMSDELAFRVRFLDPAPPQDLLYWRGVVLGNFDGRTWSPVRQLRSNPGGEALLRGRGKATRYQVTLEPHGSRMLFMLDMPQNLPDIDGGGGRSGTTNFEALSTIPVDKRLRYTGSAQTQYQLEPDGLANKEPWLALPAGFNPRAMQQGLDLQRLSDPVDRINATLQHFSREKFVYTLSPPKLGRNTVDEFLFETREGFCEHYASAFVFLMRAADVPARVVLGYQGGEYNPVDGYLTVTQAEAHAWTEVWLAGRGWVRVDPTAAVAPERVQRSLERALPSRPPFGMESMGNLVRFATGEDSWIAQLRFSMSAINNGWNQWVLDYTPERQRGFLDDLYSALGKAVNLAALLAIVALVFLARALRLRKEKDPIDALYSALCQRIGQLGTARGADESPTAFARRLDATTLPQEKKRAALRFLQLYSAHKYGPAPADTSLAATLKSLLKTI